MSAERMLVSGNEAVALAALDSGITLGTGYPGTPSTEILENFDRLGGKAQWSPNEKVALEVGLGAAYASARALVTMKHVGLNVAADPLFTAAYTGVSGALILISGDDPGLASSQNEQDNRRYAVAAGVPMLEPADSQEAYNFFIAAVELSERWRTPVLFRMTTRVCHSKTILQRTRPELPPAKIFFERDPKSRVMIPGHARNAHARLRRRLSELSDWNETCALNVRYEGGRLFIGPQREGPAAAFGGPFPTPTDAMILLGLTDIGDRSKAETAVQGIAEAMGCTVQKAAETIFEESCQIIARQVRSVLEEINNKPVYTIHELLEGKKVSPKILYIIGGPAKPMATRLGQLLECPVHIPLHYEVANAIGAALARTTAELTILADTERGIMTIGEEGISKKLPSRFSRRDALEIGRELLRERALRLGASEEDLEIEVIEDQEFNMVRDFYTTGKNIRIKLQVKPGLIAGFKTGELS